MTVKQLRERLDLGPECDDLLVVLSIDPEGNKHNPIDADFLFGSYHDGEVYGEEEDADDVPARAVPCLAIYPE